MRNPSVFSVQNHICILQPKKVYDIINPVLCGYCIVVIRDSSKVEPGVQFPLPALKQRTLQNAVFFVLEISALSFQTKKAGKTKKKGSQEEKGQILYTLKN